MLPAISVYLDTAFDAVFGLFQPPKSDMPPMTAVLICAPWGWDEVASYRSRRHWAEQLAAAGHPTLRFDLPATGDSAGMPADPGRLESWVAAISSAAEWLRGSGGGSRVAVLGLGLGGLLAREAVSKGAPIEEIVLWAAPVSGRTFVRETRAFSKLQGGRPAQKGAGSDLPEGWLEVSGFVLSAETLESLRPLDPDPSPSSPLRRALLLDRDGIEPDRQLRERLEEARIDVTVAPGAGWGEMVGHPERTKLSADVVECVTSWLRLADGASPPPGEFPSEDLSPQASRSQTPPPAMDLGVEGGRVRESPLLARQWFGDAFGVLAEPVDAPSEDLCAVFLNAGAVRHTGPNRLWVEISRRWAARGVPTLRVDLEGIGEADGDDSKRSDVAAFYVPEFEDQVKMVLDSLEERGVASRFVLVGLCAGGYWSFRTALRDPRVRTALLLNAGALKWYPDLIGDREARKLARVLSRHWWKKLLLGEIGAKRLFAFVRSILRKMGHLARRPLRLLTGHGEVSAGDRSFDADFDRLRDLDTRLTMAFSAEEALQAELRAKGIPARLERWPNIELGSLPGDDHTLRAISAQVAAREFLDGELERALERERVAPGDSGPGPAQPGARQR